MSATAQRGEPEVITALCEARERTLALVAAIDDPALERVHSTLMSPLVWDLGHIAAFEDLWIVHRLGGQPMLREDLAETYDAFETPRARRGTLDFLGPAAARAYLAEVRARALEVLSAPGNESSQIPELIVRHEHQHTETMLQTMQLAGLSGFTAQPLAEPSRTPSLSGLEFVEVPAGRPEIGALAEGFAYDNERPRHRVALPGFQIAVTPVTNGVWREWLTGGGYTRRDWWSQAGWQWRTAEGVDRPGGWDDALATERRLGEREPLHPDRPVIHVSWHEAQAFARAHGARLPTELEWEMAATWDPTSERSHAQPWGEGVAVPGVHANLDQLCGGVAVAGCLAAGASPCGCRGMIGDVWEWTSSRFDGYAGFSAFPYPEYSEVFFGGDYRVLRGGSWATRARVASASFRNWDYPQRRQIFSGVRLARDLAV
jgi:iron(II)-dependent oxidoreductase